jgi:hypothetical protein
VANTSAEERHRLFRANIERIEYAYEQSLRDGIDHPVILVFDIRDASGRAMAEDVAGKEVVKEKLTQAEEQRVNFCLLYPLSQKDAAEVASSWPSQGKALLSESFPVGVFAVVIIGSGGILWATHRIPQ